MKQLLLYLSLLCSWAIEAQEQKYILLDSITSNYTVKKYTLSTLPYKVNYEIEIYNVFSKNYGKGLDSDFIVLFSVLPDLESKSNWEEIDFSLLQKNFLPTKKLFDRVYNRTYNPEAKIEDNRQLSLVKKVKDKYFVAKNCWVNEFFCTNTPSEIKVTTNNYVIDIHQPTMPVSVLRSLYKKQFPNQEFPLDDFFWIIPKHLEHIYLANVENKEGDIIYYFYLFSNSLRDNNTISEFAYIKERGIVAGNYYGYFFPYGKRTLRGGDWLKVREPYKKELFLAEELKKEWRDKELKWQKEREREEKEIIGR